MSLIRCDALTAPSTRSAAGRCSEVARPMAAVAEAVIDGCGVGHAVSTGRDHGTLRIRRRLVGNRRFAADGEQSRMARRCAFGAWAMPHLVILYTPQLDFE